MTLHPKTSAAAVGGSLGVVIVSVLGSIHGMNLSPEANAAIPAFLSALGSWLTSDPTPTPVVVTPAQPTPVVAPPAPPTLPPPPPVVSQ